MTVVIADTSPLNYLTLIGSVEVLHRLLEPRHAVLANPDRSTCVTRGRHASMPHPLE